MSEHPCGLPGCRNRAMSCSPCYRMRVIGESKGIVMKGAGACSQYITGNPSGVNGVNIMPYSYHNNGSSSTTASTTRASTGSKRPDRAMR